MAKYPGRTLVLQGEAVRGAYETPLQAYVEALKQFRPGTFMVQPCLSGQDAYTVNVFSAATFAG